MLGSRLAFVFIVHELFEIKTENSITIDGQKLWVRTNSPDLKVVNRTLFDSEFKAIELTNPQVIIDIGAYIGTSAIYFARKFPDASVYAIEPENENFDLLQKNTANFRSVKLFKGAIWGKQEQRALLNRSTGPWGYTISETFNETHATSQMIDCIQLSDFMTMHQIEWIDLLKIDAEGSEKSIFQNAELWIDKVTVISVELHDRIVEGCTTAFNEATQNFSRFEQKGEKMTAYK